MFAPVRRMGKKETKEAKNGEKRLISEHGAGTAGQVCGSAVL
jgi:hypothetical protein